MTAIFLTFVGSAWAGGVPAMLYVHLFPSPFHDTLPAQNALATMLDTGDAPHLKTAFRLAYPALCLHPRILESSAFEEGTGTGTLDR